MADAVLDALRPAGGARLLALVNGLGGTSVLELHLLHGELDALLRARGLRVERALVGTYVSSVAMAGASITLLELDDELLELWDAPVRTAALTWTGA
jgi:dihydroxyacetone kinase-like protein